MNTEPKLRLHEPVLASLHCVGWVVSITELLGSKIGTTRCLTPFYSYVWNGRGDRGDNRECKGDAVCHYLL